MIKLLFILLSTLSFLHAKIFITVTLPVQKYFIEKIAHDEFVINVIKDEYLGFEKEKEEVVEQLAFADVYYTLGLEEEKEFEQLLLSKNNRLNIVNISKKIPKERVHGKENPYIWLDPLLVRRLCKNLLDELIHLESYKKDFFEENYKNLLNEVDDIFLYLKGRIDRSESFNIYVMEPYWHYFAKRFRINLFYRPNRYTLIEEVPSMIQEAKKEDIRKLLIREGTSYEQAMSIANSINVDIIENNIERYEWRSNLYLLVREITKK